jgi:hypothetical protein
VTDSIFYHRRRSRHRHPAPRCSSRGEPHDLPPLPESDRRAGSDEREALTLSRRRVRRFQDREVDPGLAERAVEPASTAPMGIPPRDIGCVSVIGPGEVRRVANSIVKG